MMCDSIIADTVELGKAARQREKESVMVVVGGGRWIVGVSVGWDPIQGGESS